MITQVLATRLDDLVERLHLAGLHRVSATILSSEPTSGSLHDEVRAQKSTFAISMRLA